MWHKPRLILLLFKDGNKTGMTLTFVRPIFQ